MQPFCEHVESNVSARIGETGDWTRGRHMAIMISFKPAIKRQESQVHLSKHISKLYWIVVCFTATAI